MHDLLRRGHPFRELRFCQLARGIPRELHRRVEVVQRGHAVVVAREQRREEAEVVQHARVRLQARVEWDHDVRELVWRVAKCSERQRRAPRGEAHRCGGSCPAARGGSRRRCTLSLGTA